MKKIFYYTDVLPLLSRGKDGIKKISRSLDVFRAASENVKLIWHPWSGTMKYLTINSSDVIDEYKKIVEDYLEEGWGELDNSDNYYEARQVLLGCDGYYGDVCDLIYDAQNAKIPVMIQNIDA
ncbi:hypothetical protein [Butyrivibrio fibrisolvens]|uniref:hypothetical protein n=1 Tax=Butyrivibrio fibrisolvens TaxID=831 RepID=UPI0003B39E6E|nr:hypothetical protein [Butyrivibrio fibrisolvens]